MMYVKCPFSEASFPVDPATGVLSCSPTSRFWSPFTYVSSARTYVTCVVRTSTPAERHNLLDIPAPRDPLRHPFIPERTPPPVPAPSPELRHSSVSSHSLFHTSGGIPPVAFLSLERPCPRTPRGSTPFLGRSARPSPYPGRQWGCSLALGLVDPDGSALERRGFSATAAGRRRIGRGRAEVGLVPRFMSDR